MGRDKAQFSLYDYCHSEPFSSLSRPGINPIPSSVVWCWKRGARVNWGWISVDKTRIPRGQTLFWSNLWQGIDQNRLIQSRRTIEGNKREAQLKYDSDDFLLLKIWFWTCLVYTGEVWSPTPCSNQNPRKSYRATIPTSNWLTREKRHEKAQQICRTATAVHQEETMMRIQCHILLLLPGASPLNLTIHFTLFFRPKNYSLPTVKSLQNVTSGRIRTS